MTHDRLMLEEHADGFSASLEAVKKAVAKHAIPDGPTFLNLMDENGNNPGRQAARDDLV